ncbi:MAG: DNRLRE domain-containing protein [Chitinophagaceae bacterium]|nr:DNRLRE domain-containing protein [Chitinophagaceae bacterium]
MTLKPYYLLALIGVLPFTSCQKEEIINNKVPVAEAGESQTIQIRGEAETATATLTGTGADADGNVVAYIWSQVSGPDASEIVNNGAPVTDVKGLITGTYLYQLMVVDNDGATGVDTVSVIVKGPEYITLSLQPANNLNEVAIFGNANLNESGIYSYEMGAAGWTKNGAPIVTRAVFKFDLSSIPTTAIIKNAKLSLYSHPNPTSGHQSDEVRANYGSDNTMLIQRVTNAWAPEAVTFNNQPSSTSTNQIIIPHTNQAFLDLIDVDVTQLVKDMNGTTNNYGFLIKLQTEVYYNSRIFATSKFSDTSKHPKLVVVYSK